MTKIHKLAIFFDGTWNTVDDPKLYSNVKKMKNLTIPCHRNIITDTHYMEGPGTRPGTVISGGAFAGDLPAVIHDAYNWLCIKYLEHFQKGYNPELYIFGFSRGAYLAHIFTWLLNDIGITQELGLCEKIVSAYMEKDSQKLTELTCSNTGLIPEIRMIGVWDMVSAPLDVYKGYHDGQLAPIVEKAYHAMALDEKRNFFSVLKYNVDQRIKQRWFSGVHSDIGGGYEDSTLSDIALQWMVDSAADEDLILKDTMPALTDENPDQTIDFTGMAKHDESHKKDHNPRSYDGEEIDPSVFLRIAQDSSYTPLAENFPGTANV